MGDNRTLATYLLHHSLQRAHPFLLFQIDALPGGAPYVQSLHALIHQMPGQTARTRFAHAPLIVVAGVNAGKTPLYLSKLPMMKSSSFMIDN